MNADGTSVDYFIVNGTTVAERWNYANGSEYFTMRYTFDETGNVIGFSTHYPNFTNGYWEDYLFAKNLQGDVVAMYLITVEPPRLIATYEYDEWGKVTAVRDATGAILTDPAHLANRNPFRYRGYHYDTETGFYYLQSRYYDPAISRFINADSYGSTGQAFLGTNMFAYCNNNPIMYADAFGTSPAWWQWAISGAMVVAGAVLTVTGVGGAAGGALICAGANSIVGSYTSEASGGSSIAGWTGGMITGALSGYGAGKAGTMFIAASDLTGTACLSQVALGGATSFLSGGLGSGLGTTATAVINGQKLNAKDIFSAAVTGGTINMLAGIASAIGSGVYKMPAISETSKVAASALSTSWSIAAEAVCDAVSVVIGLIAN